MVTKQNEEIFYIGDGSHLTVKSTTIVEMCDHLKLMVGDGEDVSLDVKILADFEKIPPKYHFLLSSLGFANGCVLSQMFTIPPYLTCII